MRHLKKIDIFYTPVKLKFKNHESYASILGGLLTILLTFITIALLVATGDNLYNRKNPSVNQQLLRFKNGKRITLNQEKIMIAFSFHSDYVNEIMDPRNFELNIYHYNKTSESNSHSTSEVKRISQGIVKCVDKPNFISKFAQFINLTSVLHENDFSKWLCLTDDTENTLIGGEYQSNFFSNIYFEAKYCQSSINNYCNNIENAKKFIRNTNVNMHYIDSEINWNNYTHPFNNSFLNSFFTKIDPILFVQTDIYFTEMEMITDAGLVFKSENREPQRIWTLSNYKEMRLSTEDSLLLRLYINSGFQKNLTKRIYMKLQELLAFVGGFSKAVMVVSTIICEYFNQYLFDEEMINTFFVDTAFSEKLRRKNNFLDKFMLNNFALLNNRVRKRQTNEMFNKQSDMDNLDNLGNKASNQTKGRSIIRAKDNIVENELESTAFKPASFKNIINLKTNVNKPNLKANTAISHMNGLNLKLKNSYVHKKNSSFNYNLLRSKSTEHTYFQKNSNFYIKHGFTQDVKYNIYDPMNSTTSVHKDNYHNVKSKFNLDFPINNQKSKNISKILKFQPNSPYSIPDLDIGKIEYGKNVDKELFTAPNLEKYSHVIDTDPARTFDRIGTTPNMKSCNDKHILFIDMGHNSDNQEFNNNNHHNHNLSINNVENNKYNHMHSRNSSNNSMVALTNTKKPFKINIQNNLEDKNYENNQIDKKESKAIEVGKLNLMSSSMLSQENSSNSSYINNNDSTRHLKSADTKINKHGFNITLKRQLKTKKLSDLEKKIDENQDSQKMEIYHIDYMSIIGMTLCFCCEKYSKKISIYEKYIEKLYAITDFEEIVNEIALFKEFRSKKFNNENEEGSNNEPVKKNENFTSIEEVIESNNGVQDKNNSNSSFSSNKNININSDDNKSINNVEADGNIHQKSKISVEKKSTSFLKNFIGKFLVLD